MRVTAVDAGAGTVSLDHEAIAAISWPAMSMQFTVEDPSKLQGIAVGDRVSIGSNATLLPVSICSDVVIGAGAVVTRDITEPGVYAGNPAKQLPPKQPTP